MSLPDAGPASRRLRDGQPAFAEQWHAEVTALVELLIADGKLDAGQWSRALGAERDRRAAEGAPDTDDTFYAAFLSALEAAMDRANMARAADVDRRETDWRDAYLTTPHGRPVVLKT